MPAAKVLSFVSSWVQVLGSTRGGCFYAKKIQRTATLSYHLSYHMIGCSEAGTFAKYQQASVPLGLILQPYSLAIELDLYVARLML